LTWHRIDTSTRNSDGRFDVADTVGSEGKLVYLSLGSLGCASTPRRSGCRPHRAGYSPPT
jgi:hypothetical protein